MEINEQKSFYTSRKEQTLSCIARHRGKYRYLGFIFDERGLVMDVNTQISTITNYMKGTSKISNKILTKAAIVNVYSLSKIWFTAHLGAFLQLTTGLC